MKLEPKPADTGVNFFVSTEEKTPGDVLDPKSLKN
jgi:hypothetical protein